MCLQMHRSSNVCSEAENGEDAVELARRLKPDIVLLDYAIAKPMRTSAINGTPYVTA